MDGSVWHLVRHELVHQENHRRRVDEQRLPNGQVTGQGIARCRHDCVYRGSDDAYCLSLVVEISVLLDGGPGEIIALSEEILE